jgi:hypothetical protein
MGDIENGALCLAALFLLYLLFKLLHFPGIFFKRHGRRHRLFGLLYLFWMLLGYAEICWGTTPFVNHSLALLAYDCCLGVLGICLTVSAAIDFPHKGVENVASGTLDEHATVTYSEMIEHSFYQGVNLVQILYLHAVDGQTERWLRILLGMGATCPWLIRHAFPVNRFSDNYTKIDSKSTPLVRLLYRIKKYQYVFYKHFLLHGLNISVALFGPGLSGRPLACEGVFR